MIIACLTPAYLLFDTYTSRKKGGLPKWGKKEIFITIPMTKNLHSLQIDMKGSSKIKNGLFSVQKIKLLEEQQLMQGKEPP